MENEKITWKVGDVVLVHSWYHGWSKDTVAKTTQTQAILASGVKLRQLRFDGDSAIGDSGFHQTRYYANTPERIQEMTQNIEKRYAIAHKLAVFADRSGPKPEIVSRIVALHKEAMAKIAAVLAESEVQNA